MFCWIVGIRQEECTTVFVAAGGARAERDYPPPESIATVPHVLVLVCLMLMTSSSIGWEPERPVRARPAPNLMSLDGNQ